MARDLKWLVVGANGMLGSELTSLLAGRDMVGLDLPAIDITDAASTDSAVEGFDIVVNCAAWTAVDDAETRESAAFRVNALGPSNLADACAQHGSRMVQISTDYVFDGEATSPYVEDAAPNPLSVYGRTKLAGEWGTRVALPNGSWVLRRAWLYGANGPNFVKTMANLEQERDQLVVVDDQRGQPTWARDLAGRIIEMVDRDVPPGVYHATNSGETTWWGFARTVFELLGADPDRITPTTTDQFPRPAHRPANSTLSHDRWRDVGMEPLRPWQAALDAAWRDGLLDSE